MRKDNTQNYQTGQTNIRHFRDFTQNVKVEKEELKKMSRNQMKNSDGPNLSNIPRKKWNKVSKKWDDISKGEIDARLDELVSCFTDIIAVPPEVPVTLLISSAVTTPFAIATV